MASKHSLGGRVGARKQGPQGPLVHLAGNTQDAELMEPAINSLGKFGYKQASIEVEHHDPDAPAEEAHFDREPHVPHMLDSDGDEDDMGYASEDAPNGGGAWNDSVVLHFETDDERRQVTGVTALDEPPPRAGTLELSATEMEMQELGEEDIMLTQRELLGTPGLNRLATPVDHSGADTIRYQGISVWALHTLAVRLENGDEASGTRLFVTQVSLGPQGPVPEKEDPDPGVVPRYSTVRLLMEHGDGTWLLEEPCSGNLVRARPEHAAMKTRRQWTLEDVCQFVVLPMAFREERIYVDLLAECDRGPMYEGAYVSQPHCSPFADFVDALKGYCDSNNVLHEDQFVWVDVFCSNQRRLAAHGKGTDHGKLRRARQQLLHADLQRVMTKFKVCVLFFGRWDRPQALQRAWCVWEVYQAILQKRDVEVLFAVGQQEQFIKTLQHSFDTVTQHLLEIDIRKASCHDKEDSEMIRDAISRLNGGFSKLNSTLLHKLREIFCEWIHPAIKHQKDHIAQGAGDAGAGMPNSVEGQRRRGKQLRLARLLNQAGRFLDVQQPDRARKYYDDSREYYESLCGAASAQCAAVHNNIALLERKRGNLDEARQSLETALRIQEGNFDAAMRDADARAASSMSAASTVATANNNNAGNSNQDEEATGSSSSSMSGHLPPAPDASGTASAVPTSGPLAQLRNKPRLELSVTHNNLGKVLYLSRNYAKALVHYEEALRLRTEMDPMGDEEAARDIKKKCASIHGNIAMIRVAEGDYEGALLKYQEVLDLKLSAFNDDRQHPSLATTYNSIAFVHYRRRNVRKALALYELALEINRRAFGDQSTRVAYVLVRLALILREQGRLEESMECLNEALDIQLEAAGSSSLDTADTRNQMAVTLRLMGKVEDAREACNKALKTRRNLLKLKPGARLTEQHLPIASSLWNLAVILFELGPASAEAARKAAAEALDIRRAVLGSGHPRTIECFALLTGGLQNAIFSKGSRAANDE